MTVKFDVQVERRDTASGFEWFLSVGGRRVPLNTHGTGVFTSEGHIHPGPEVMLPRLLAAAARAEERRVA